MDFKSRISTPLEAGTSILDVHRLPSYLIPALEYASKRLAEKGLHVTLVVARRDYQLPGYSIASKPTSSPDVENTFTPLPTPPCSPASPDLSCGSRSSMIRSMVRSHSQQNLRGTEKQDFARPKRSKTNSLSKKCSLATLFDSSLGSPRLRWAVTTPSTSSCSPRTPRTPATPASFCPTPASSASSAACGSLGAHGPEIRLIHATPLAPRAYRLVTATLARASRRYNLVTTLTAHEPSTYNLPSVVLHSSILQNETLHASDGITLLSLDHLYTFKSALSHYTATRTQPGSHFALEDAVDELRRYVLSSAAGRRRLLKSTLVQAFEWLGPVDDTALAEVLVIYARAYGGTTDTGVVNDLLHVAASTAWHGDVHRASALGMASMLTPDVPLRNAAKLATGDFSAVDAVPLPLSLPIRQVGGGDSRSSSPALSSTPGLLSLMSAASWVRLDSPSTDSEPASTLVDAPLAPAFHKPNWVVEEGSGGEKTPVPSKACPQTPRAQNFSAPLPSRTATQLPAPKLTPRPLAPTLKLQTSFPALQHPANKRKKTPAPSARSLPDAALSMPIFLSATSPSPTPTITDIKLPLSPAGANDDAASVQTDFEDAELTARSPDGATATKTPGGSIWLGIDDLLLSAVGHGARTHSWIGRRRRSSDVVVQTPTPAAERMGPMTPNGYEDISPVTRGEWGFLMVGESFRTRTAGVSCV